MQSRLDHVLDNFKEYIRNLRISNIDGALEIEYSMIAYDYIDGDLDFNEDYYAGLCDSFQKWMETTAKDMIRLKEIKSVKLVRNRMIFRNKDGFVDSTLLAPCDDPHHIKIVKETREKM